MASQKPWERFAAPEGQGPWSKFAAEELFGEETKGKKSTIGSELVRGGKQLASSIQTGVGALFGSPEEAAIAGIERGRRISEEAGEGVSLEAVKRAYEKEGLLSAAGEVVGQIPRALAGQGAQLAAMAAAGKGGAMLGAPLGPAGALIGGIGGAAASLLPQFLGSNVERQVQEQIEAGQAPDVNLGRAGAAAAGQAAIESAGTAFVLGKRLVKGFLGVADDAALATTKARQDMVKAAERSLLAASGRGAVRGGAEIPVEVAQQVIERAQAGLDVTSPEALSEYGEAAYQAALVGGPLGAVSGPVDTAMARSARTRIEGAEAEQEKQRVAQEKQAEQQRIAAERAAEEERMRPVREAEQREREAAEARTPYYTRLKKLQLELQQEKTPEAKEELAFVNSEIARLNREQIERQRSAAEAQKQSVFAEAELPAPITRDELMAPPVVPETKAEIPGAEEPTFNLLRSLEARNQGLMSTLEARRTAAEDQAEVARQERESRSAAERADADRRMFQVENFLLSPARKTQQETADYIADVVPEMRKDFLALLDEDLNQPLTPEQTEALKTQIRQRLMPEAAPEPEVGRTRFKRFLATMGINKQDASDIFGDNAFRANQRLPGAIRADAPRLDMLAEAAVEAGFLQTEDPDALIQMIKDEFFGIEQAPLDMADERAAAELEERRLGELQSRAAEIGLDTRGMTPEQIIGRLNRIERTREQQRQRRERETEARTEAEIAEATTAERQERAEAIGAEAVPEVEALRRQAREQGIDTSAIEEQAFEEARDNPDLNPDTILAERLSDALGAPRFFDIRPASGKEQQRNPSFKRRVTQLKKELDEGKIGEGRFINEVDWALKQAEEARDAAEPKERTRGADYIRQRLLEAKRRGDLSEEAVDFAEWFIQRNPDLVDDLGISIRRGKEDGVAGEYNALARIMRLIKEAEQDTTVVHEILHHLERMMPKDVQRAIRSAWSKKLASAAEKAKSEKEKQFFKLLTDHHFSDAGRAAFQLATQMIKDGDVDYSNYQYTNPSEFWAVNGTEIMKGRFDAVRGGVLARLKNWLKELATKLVSAFGVTNNAPIIRALDSLSKGDGKFITSDMLSAGVYQDIAAPKKREATAEKREAEPKPKQTRLNIAGEPVLGSWNIQADPKMELQDGLIYKFLDKNIDVKRIVESIEKLTGEIAQRWNPYLQEELYHGRTAAATQEFADDEWQPLLKEMDKLDVTIGELEQYLHNRHAEDYNKLVAKRNPDRPEMQDGGSQIKTEDARKYLADLSPEKRKKYEALAKRIDDITKGTRELLVKNGYETPERIEAWEKAFPNYVPLMREEEDFDYNFGSFGTGRGFDVRRDFSRSAMGSKRQVVDIIGNIIAARNNAIMLTEKNRVAQAVYGLAVQNPNPDFWLAVNPDAEKQPADVIEELNRMGIDEDDFKNLAKEPLQRSLDPKTNKVISRVNDALRKNNYVLATRINGERRYVFFNPKDERSKRAVTALKNLDAENLGMALGAIAKVTRWMAAVNTQYNPIFGIYNFLRDTQAAALQLSTTPLAGKQIEVSKEILPSLRAIYGSLRKRHKGEKVDTEMAQLWREFQKEGGQTGFKDVFSRTQDRQEALVNEMMRIKEGKTMKAGRAIVDWLSDYNDTLENAVRLSAYKVAKKKFIDEGKTETDAKQLAASLAKNLTVNFNRKGDAALQAGALYAFFNASMQGTARAYQTLKGPMGKKILAGGLLWGVIQASIYAFAGFDEDEPPEFVRERNIVIPTGDGDYLAFPMPLGYHVIPGVSRIISEWALSGFRDTPDRIASLTGMFLEAFNPIGNAGWSVQTIAPTFADPIVALAENRDWTGKPIAKEDMFSLDPTPGYTRARDGANVLTSGIAKFLNFATGGTRADPGLVSPTPEQIEYLIGQALGGIGREVTKGVTSIEKAVTGEELPPYKIPLYGRFVGETKSSAAESNRFYKNMEKLNILDREIKVRKENREPIGDFMRENPEARLAPMAQKTYRDIQELRKRREKLVERDAPRESVKAVEEQIRRRMAMFNERVAQLRD